MYCCADEIHSAHIDPQLNHPLDRLELQTGTGCANSPLRREQPFQSVGAFLDSESPMVCTALDADSAEQPGEKANGIVLVGWNVGALAPITEEEEPPLWGYRFRV